MTPSITYMDMLALAADIVAIITFCMYWFKQRQNRRVQEEFVTIVTHKFRTPLTGIKWAIDSLRQDLTQQQREDVLKQIEAANTRLLEIIDLIVGFVRFDSRLEYAYAAASLREMIDDALTKHGEEIRRKGITFTIDANQSLPLVVIDKTKIQFVLDVIIDNSVKYTSENGTVAVMVKLEKKSVLISIRDNGVGMTFLERQHLFKRFYRSDDARRHYTEGMGLGLYTAWAIVKKHGGRLWVESPGQNKGSTFFIRLPLR
jgi:signal transduction histidine kinase